MSHEALSQQGKIYATGIYWRLIHHQPSNIDSHKLAKCGAGLCRVVQRWTRGAVGPWDVSLHPRVLRCTNVIQTLHVKNTRLVLMTTNNKPKETKYESVRLASVAIPRLVFDAWVSPSVSLLRSWTNILNAQQPTSWLRFPPRRYTMPRLGHACIPKHTTPGKSKRKQWWSPPKTHLKRATGGRARPILEVKTSKTSLTWMWLC